MTPERYREKALYTLREATQKHAFMAMCCPDCEMRYRPILESLKEALRVAEISIRVSKTVLSSSQRNIRRLLEMSHRYAWGPEGSAVLRDEWLALYGSYRKERNGDLFVDPLGYVWES